MTWAQVWTGITNRLIYASQPLLNMISYIAQNWSAIEPIVLSLAVAVGVYAAALGWHNAVQMVSNFLSTVAAAKSALKAGATLAEAAATKTATGAQVGLRFWRLSRQFICGYVPCGRRKGKQHPLLALLPGFLRLLGQAY